MSSKEQRAYWARRRATEEADRQASMRKPGYRLAPAHHCCEAADIDYGDPGPTFTSTCRECGRIWRFSRGGGDVPASIRCSPITPRKPRV